MDPIEADVKWGWRLAAEQAAGVGLAVASQQPEVDYAAAHSENGATRHPSLAFPGWADVVARSAGEFGSAG